MEWIIIILLVTVVYLISRKGKTKEDSTQNPIQRVEVLEKESISEEDLFEVQNRFETRLIDEIDFPDAIRGREIYIYKVLMRPWFNKLAAKYRYDEKMIQKLRTDWLDYIESIQTRATSGYLSLELSDEQKANKHRERHVAASKKMYAIEEAFAEAVAGEAPKELDKAHDLEYNEVGKHGELAPEGFKWDLGRENLVPAKGSK